MELAIYDLCCAACGAKASDAQSWGQVFPGEGGKDKPIGNACGPCLEVAEARWPQSRWEDLIQKPDMRSRIKSMAAVRSGKEPADFIPKTVESKVKTSVRWVNVEKPMSIPELQPESKANQHQ